jgi:hypothetical protein
MANAESSQEAVPIFLCSSRDALTYSAYVLISQKITATRGRHARESGHPSCFDPHWKMDARFRGHDGLESRGINQTFPRGLAFHSSRTNALVAPFNIR